MRIGLALLPLTVMAASAAAQQPAAKPPAPQAARPQPAPPALPRELTDPATAQKLAGMMQALSKAFLNMPVGEIEAAVEGRPVTAADRKKTVLSEGRKDDPHFERHFQAQLASTGPMMEAGMKALAASLPAMMQAMARASSELEKAAANMPRPDYPKR